MEIWLLVAGCVLGLVGNEFLEVSPWLARRLLPHAARLWTDDTDRREVLTEAWLAIIEERPGKLLKLLSSLAFWTTGLARSVSRERIHRSFALSTGKWLRGNKILTALGAGGIVFLITNMFVYDIMWSVVLSVFIGGVVVVVHFLAEFEKRLAAVETRQQSHFTAVEDLIRYGFTGINEATELFGRVENSAIRTDLVKQLVHHSANLGPSSHTLIHLFAHSEITRVSDLMKGLSERGEITYEGENHDSLLALTRNAQTTIDAVDASGQGFGGELWKSDLGQRYLKAQQKALDRKVTIRRVFMLDDPEGARDPELLRICEIQRELGILVRLLDPLTPPGLHHNWLFDFIVFDSAISFESTPAASAKKGTKPAIVSTRLVLSPQRVAERVQGFEELWAAARELYVS